ncbi:uncharacterized protein LOC124447907 isoform X1 [Xenia sp. Carnegie-2017]|uniref:uncharacterized protein LOC124447907 isoform X1 n=1 Tax=Xenia sp. Carnegie-2017 TaxID=2897299 RepID=UPI001F03E1C2|nr:uncharacterized protein LOC124447907 isoform X1 [Xenia sp. Carnegie-2017]
MSTFEEEKDVRDLVLLNAEMQTIWNKKECEVRDVLEKFSAYRAAVDSDAKEKDELFVEEIGKREKTIKDLELKIVILQDEMCRQNETFKAFIADVQTAEKDYIQQLVDVIQIVQGLSDSLDKSSAQIICHNIRVQIETFVAKFKERDYRRYINCCDDNGSELKSADKVKTNTLTNTFLSSSMDEVKGFSLISSPEGEQLENFYSEDVFGQDGNILSLEQFSSDIFSFVSTKTSNNEHLDHEISEEDFSKLSNEVDSFENDFCNWTPLTNRQL